MIDLTGPQGGDKCLLLIEMREAASRTPLLLFQQLGDLTMDLWGGVGASGNGRSSSALETTQHRTCRTNLHDVDTGGDKYSYS